MDFVEFRNLLQAHFEAMLEGQSKLFVADVDKDALWETYLNSFPPDANRMFRERREHDCSACRHFVKSFGNVVIINGENHVVTLWDFQVHDAAYSKVTEAMSELIRSAPIRDVFVTKEPSFGVDCNFEQKEDGIVKRWEHFFVKLPKELVTRGNKSEASIIGEYRDVRNVFKRSLDEISQDALESVLDLISQRYLYKGEEWQVALTRFLDLHTEYHGLPSEEHDAFAWRKSVEVAATIGKIKNHSIGVLLTDISQGMDLDEAVRRYESIVAPTNYKRPRAIFTKRMVEQAQETLQELSLVDSLKRRHATIEDITVNNILYANRDALKQMSGGDVFAELGRSVTVASKAFSKTDEVGIDQFVEHILPRVTSLEAMLENSHVPNLVSLIAPAVPGSPSLFKWPNGFSWAYNGNITDSMKERVKAAGGNVEGVLRFSLEWNDNGDNPNDFDAHCIEPSGNRIYYPNKRHVHQSSGMLDVDIIHPDGEVAVENIAWTDKRRMPTGLYQLGVHNYQHRGGRSGFSAEIEFDGQVFSFTYDRDIKQSEFVPVAYVTLDGSGQFHLKELLPVTASSRQAWGLTTQQFHPVSTVMYSPNYWDGQFGIGHRHYFFMLTGCVNDTAPNGFFNEFLREDLMAHKRVFEALGGKMRVEPSPDQLSGIGFSSTKPNSLVCKLDGHVKRTIKIVF